MALVTISGFPSSGKTKRAEQIRTSLEKYLAHENYQGPISKVAVLSDDVLNLNRSSYDESRSEKPARGALFTAMQRQMAVDTILIVDALNYIKGFRYQMYCAAREMKLRVCTIYVVAMQEQCREWNATRQDGLTYAPETLENLLFRYEEPSSMVRWDSPLFTVLWDEDAPPMPQIWDAITKGNIKPPNSGTLSVVKAPTDALQALEQTTAALVSAILAEQTGLGGQLNLSISTPSSTLKPSIVLPPRNITLSELQRLKRQFVTVHKKAITLGTTEKGAVDWGEESIASKFVTYLEEHIKS
ncbi:chromatin associated protein KTI12 [Lyophyllum atratum]|nr:chromatin associated protein KTI12 [Lyophyllum atratum]